MENKSKVTHAEWNPDNEVIVYIAEINEENVITGKKERVILDNISEEEASPSVVKEALAHKGYKIELPFRVD